MCQISYTEVYHCINEFCTIVIKVGEPAAAELHTHRKRFLLLNGKKKIEIENQTIVRNCSNSITYTRSYTSIDVYEWHERACFNYVAWQIASINTASIQTTQH